jgi:hypothetical protein
MRPILFYLFAFAFLAASHHAFPELFVTFQVAMWVIVTLHTISTLAVLAGNEAAIAALKGVKPSLPRPITTGLYIGLSVSVGAMGAPVLAGVMLVLALLNPAVKERLQ